MGFHLAPPEGAVEDFEGRCEALKSRLRQDDFLNNRGLGNEVGIYTFCYDPTLEPQARLFFQRLAADETLPCRVRIVNLYDVLLGICEAKKIMAGIPAMERKKGSEGLKEQLKKIATPAAFAKAMAAEPAQPGDVIVIAGVGEVYPFMRVHNVLDNIQQEGVYGGVPVIVAYPGRFDGQTLSLFGRLADGNYYRAFDLI